MYLIKIYQKYASSSGYALNNGMHLHVRIGIYGMMRGTERAATSLMNNRDLEITKADKEIKQRSFPQTTI